MTQFSTPKVTIDLEEYLKLKESLTVDYVKFGEVTLTAYKLLTSTNPNNLEKAKDILKRTGLEFKQTEYGLDTRVLIVNKELFEKAFKLQ